MRCLYSILMEISFIFIFALGCRHGASTAGGSDRPGAGNGVRSPLTFAPKVVAGQAACVQQFSPHLHADARSDPLQPALTACSEPTLPALKPYLPTRIFPSTPVAHSSHITPSSTHSGCPTPMHSHHAHAPEKRC